MEFHLPSNHLLCIGLDQFLVLDFMFLPSVSSQLQKEKVSIHLQNFPARIMSSGLLFVNWGGTQFLFSFFFSRNLIHGVFLRLVFFFFESVVGLNFDFLVLNLMKQSFYLMYNASMFFSPVIQWQYHEKYGYGEVVRSLFPFLSFFFFLLRTSFCLLIGSGVLYNSCSVGFFFW